MQVCTSLQTDNHANTPPLSFLQAGCPSCRPTNSVKALKDSKIDNKTTKEYDLKEPCIVLKTNRKLSYQNTKQILLLKESQ